MAKIKIPYKGEKIEVEGDVDEIFQLIQRFFGASKSISPTKTQEQLIEAVNSVKMPTVEEIFSFLDNESAGAGGDFRHTLGEIQERFLGRVYHSKDLEERRIFYKIYDRVLKARKKIEKKYGGKWKYEIAPTRERIYWLEKK